MAHRNEYRKRIRPAVQRNAFRVCLRCNETFLSESPSNRICGACRRLNDGAPLGRLAEKRVPDPPAPRTHLYHKHE